MALGDIAVTQMSLFDHTFPTF